jgi:hypothetical protein
MAPEHKTMATLLVSDTASQRGDTMLETPPRKNRDQRQVGKVEREKFGAATCKICQDTIEDLHHFAVGCLDKWKVWHHAMIQYDTSFATYTPSDIWKTLNFIDIAQMDILVLEHVGKTFLSTLRYHWTCFRLEKIWNHGEAIGMYEAEISRYQE